MFDLVIAVDWSAAEDSSEKPKPDRCWLCVGTPERVATPEYLPTRAACEHRIHRLLEEHRDQRCLVAFDFAIGLPAMKGQAIFHSIREQCRFFAEHVIELGGGKNNRYEAAAAINRHITSVARERGLDPDAPGPFWGRPQNSDRFEVLKDNPRPKLPDQKDRERLWADRFGVKKARTAELKAAAQMHKRRGSTAGAQSVWKLAGVGSVGSQTLTGLPAVHRIVKSPNLGPRTYIWPFEPMPEHPNAITIAEIFPSLFPWERPERAHWFPDAAQVTHVCERFLRDPPELDVWHPDAVSEGWILGVTE